MKYRYDVLIQEFHLDTFGHVNNASYVMLYEQARWDFITKEGLGLDYIKKHHVGPVILHFEISFKKELLNRQSIQIQSEFMKMMNSKICCLKQMMVSQDGKTLFSEASFQIGFFDLKSRKLIPWTDQWLALLKN